MSPAEPHNPTFEPPAPQPTWPVAPEAGYAPAVQFFPAEPTEAAADGGPVDADRPVEVERVGRGLAFALGAIVSPPDAVAAKAVLPRLALPRQLLTFQSVGLAERFQSETTHPQIFVEEDERSSMKNRKRDFHSLSDRPRNVQGTNTNVPLDAVGRP